MIWGAARGWGVWFVSGGWVRPDCRVGGRFSGVLGRWVRVGWSAERSAYSGESFGDVGRPAPGLVDPEVDSAGAVGEAGGDVQDAVAERGDLAAGECGDVGEADLFGPADQVDRGQYDLEPGLVLVEGSAGEVAQPGCLGFSDPVLDAGVLAVPQLQAGGLPGHHTRLGVGQDRGDPVSVDVGEGQLCAGVGAFLAQDQPGPFGPAS